MTGGASLQEAFEEAATALFAYMTDLRTVNADASQARDIEASGTDLPSLLFHFLDELLFLYGADYFIAKRVTISELDRAGFRVRAHWFVAGPRPLPYRRQRHDAPARPGD